MLYIYHIGFKRYIYICLFKALYFQPDSSKKDQNQLNTKKTLFSFINVCFSSQRSYKTCVYKTLCGNGLFMKDVCVIGNKK